MIILVTERTITERFIMEINVNSQTKTKQTGKRTDRDTGRKEAHNTFTDLKLA